MNAHSVPSTVCQKYAEIRILISVNLTYHYYRLINYVVIACHSMLVTSMIEFHDIFDLSFLHLAVAVVQIEGKGD